jgi:hypothetical protein
MLPLAGLRTSLERFEAVEKGVQGNARFRPRERGAEAEVDAVAKREVPA